MNNKDIANKTFYERYNNVCKQKKTSPSKIAESIGLSKASVNHWKKGSSPKAEIVIKLTKELNTTSDYLLGLSDTEKAENKLTDKEIELLKLFDTVPNDKKEQVLDLFKYQINLIK